LERKAAKAAPARVLGSEGRGGMRLSSETVALVLAGVLCRGLAAQSKPGTVCVTPISPTRPERVSPGGDYNPATLTLRFAKRETIRWSTKDWMKFEQFDPSVRHLVALTSDGKRVQSFWFRFSDYRSESRCLAFDGYQGVQLYESATARCKCK
jgi:hypothetical protein